MGDLVICSVPSERAKGAIWIPGRCPGLVWVAPLGQFRMRLPYRAGTRPSTGQDKADDDPLGVPHRAMIRPADNPSGCPNGARHTSPGCNPGYGCGNGLRSVGTPHRARVGGRSGDIGVGMAVAGHPSLRTGLADFPHPALQSVSHPLAAGLVRLAKAKAYREISPSFSKNALG